jgi:UDP-N-acetylmuramate--alanine ligase
MDKKDCLMCLPIYDAGGTADRNISSKDLIRKVKGPECVCPESRKDALVCMKKMARPGDIYAVMGARDDTLSVFAKRILREIG